MARSKPRRRVPPRVHIFNTERPAFKPVQTCLSFPLESTFDSLRLHVGPCGHAPSPDELTTAPFYPDPSRRVIAFNLGEFWWFANTEELLKLAQERARKTIQWDEWATKRMTVRIKKAIGRNGAWVSGCRFFCAVADVTGGPRSYLRVLDLSRADRIRELHALDLMGTGETTGQRSPGSDWYELPWHPSRLRRATLTVAHDSVVFGFVSVVGPSSSPRSNEAFLFIAHPGRGPSFACSRQSASCVESLKVLSQQNWQQEANFFSGFGIHGWSCTIYCELGVLGSIEIPWFRVCSDKIGVIVWHTRREIGLVPLTAAVVMSSISLRTVLYTLHIVFTFRSETCKSL